MARTPKKAGISVEATVHRSAQRTNIPTAELERFAPDDERMAKKVQYLRDPALDPQLVWKGKDEQDSLPLWVDAVPIYIQEKVHPRVLIDELRTASKRADPELQVDLFSDFNGLEFEKLVEFYQHPMKWQNRLILGDSLLVMASLAEKEGLRGKVQMIYVDPPYGIRFGSNWQVSTRKRDVRDGKLEDATRQPEQIKAFRDTWNLGIHSYLAYLRDRLIVARDLLNETGSIFVQIGDENVHLVRAVMDEVFGSENFVAHIAFRVKSALGVANLGRVCDHLAWYARSIDHLKYRQLYTSKTREDQAEFNMVELPDGQRLSYAAATRVAGELPKGTKFFTAQNLASSGYTPSCTFVFDHAGKSFPPPAGHSWKTTRDGMQRLAAAHRLLALPGSLRYVYYVDDFPVQELPNVWMDTFGEQDKEYVVQTSTRVIERCMLMATDPGDLVVDPTCGSGTTAYVAEQWGRRWITIDTSRVALALARTRLMAARFPFYLLADSRAGVSKEAELTGVIPELTIEPTHDVTKGFIYERVPHVTLKSIANNPEIIEGMTREEVDAAIGRHAESEALYDRPYSDSKTVRVTGPFTVESLSPHRVVAAIGESGASPIDKDPAPFIDRIIQNLKKAGVQNTVKGERLIFDRLELWPGGVYIQAAGEFSENGKAKTVAICLGPEYGTVGSDLVREAAKEAVKFADLLVVCGFAFEAHVGDEGLKLGRLTILKARINPDLSMGDEVLKKTGTGNLFMVFGEPDINVESIADDMVTVEIRGVDTYNPTTGEIRSDSIDEIACWFVDTDYNSESFFVRHAYFLGADDPYDSLRKTLRSEIDETTWSTLYRATSRPFPRPSTGKIAIKVINHYGDEVLKVYPVSRSQT